MDLSLSPEQQEIRRLVREFAEREIKPRAAAIDHTDDFPRDLVAKAAQLGLLGILVPEAYSGAGLGHVAFAVFVEEVARYSASTAGILDVHGSVGTEPIVLFGNEEQKRRWLPDLANGKKLAAFALTEPEAGSDAAHLKTIATHQNGKYVLRGTKIFITNAGEAQLYVVMATTHPGSGAEGITTFLVGGDNPGLKVGPKLKKMGLNGSAIAEVHLEDCAVDETDRLGNEGEGFRIAMRALDSGRIGISAQAVGLAQGALDDAIAYAKERKQFGKPIAELQTIQNKIADMTVKVSAARWMTWKAAALCDAGQPFTKAASMAKLFATDAAMEITLDALQVFGGYGYLEDYPMARRVRDAKACQIYEGTNQVQRVVIARELMPA
ncbi:MAG: acyl-CoA dehydrogenase [Chloroflexi bacterium]|nr:MAG: acyl-CoA dehydrogenase [Chloroflexota bacterium]